jgi:hypothetical protein
MDRAELLRRLQALRDSIHSVNRNPVPNRCRIAWRDTLDRLMMDIETGASTDDIRGD